MENIDTAVCTDHKYTWKIKDTSKVIQRLFPWAHQKRKARKNPIRKIHAALENQRTNKDCYTSWINNKFKHDLYMCTYSSYK